MSAVESSNGLLLIWHDVVPDHCAAVRRWYNEEHHFERLEVPGFNEARRFERISGVGGEILGLYQVDAPNVLLSTAYMNRLANPSKWTQLIMPHFRNMCRTVCDVLVQGGQTNGNFIAAVAARKTHAPSKTSLLSAIESLHGIQRWRISTASPLAVGQGSSEARLRDAEDSLVEWAILIDTDTKENADAALLALTRLAGEAVLSHTAVYQQVFCAGRSPINPKANQP